MAQNSNILARMWADLQTTFEDVQRRAEQVPRKAQQVHAQIDDAELEARVRDADPEGRTVVVLPRRAERQQVEGG